MLELWSQSAEEKKIAGIYIRVSTENQAREGFSYSINWFNSLKNYVDYGKITFVIIRSYANYNKNSKF